MNENYRNLAYAVMQQGVEDTYKGDPCAIAWLDSRSFDYWCAYLDIDVDAAREGIKRQLAAKAPKWPEAKMRRAVELHRTGLNWRDCAWRVFGSRSGLLLKALSEYDKIHSMRPSIAHTGVEYGRRNGNGA